MTASQGRLTGLHYDEDELRCALVLLLLMLSSLGLRRCSSFCWLHKALAMVEGYLIHELAFCDTPR